MPDPGVAWVFALPAGPGAAQRATVATIKRIGPEEIQAAIRQLASTIARDPAPGEFAPTRVPVDVAVLPQTI